MCRIFAYDGLLAGDVEVVAPFEHRILGLEACLVLFGDDEGASGGFLHGFLQFLQKTPVVVPQESLARYGDAHFLEAVAESVRVAQSAEYVCLFVILEAFE